MTPIWGPKPGGPKRPEPTGPGKQRTPPDPIYRPKHPPEPPPPNPAPDNGTGSPWPPRPGGPSAPGGPPGPGRGDDLMDLADTLGFQTPVRQVQTARAVDPVSTPGGPVRISGRAEEPRPDGGVPGVPQPPAVAADVPFTLPPTPAVPVFCEPDCPIGCCS